MPQARLISLDVFRGLTVAAMVLVNNPGSWTYVYPPLRHAAWHGWTPTDLIFPFFLFIVGMSIALSMGRRVEEGQTGSRITAKIFKRAAMIFALGLFLHLFPKFRFATMRIPGVLQRIAVCFLFGALIYLKVKPRGRAVLAAAILIAYVALLILVPVPGYGPGVLEPKGNLCGYVDTLLLRGHLYKPDFDPEGIPSTLPAIATVLLGTLAGDALRSRRGDRRKALDFLAVGAILTAAGLFAGRYHPINKPLWTSSYVVFTAGAALVVFAGLFALFEKDRLRWLAWPFRVLGTNAIVVFAGSALMVKALLLIKIPDAGGMVSPITWAYTHGLSPLAGPYLGSLLYPIGLLLLWVLLIWPLYRNRIFIKL